MRLRARQAGAILVISMIFMVVLTVIGISSLGRTELEERMSINFQEQNRAFQVAETGIAQVLANLGLFSTESGGSHSTGEVGSYGASAQQSISYIDKTQVRRNEKGWGIGSAQFHHFNINSTGTGNNSAQADVNRGVRIIGANEE